MTLVPSHVLRNDANWIIPESISIYALHCVVMLTTAVLTHNEL